MGLWHQRHDREIFSAAKLSDSSLNIGFAVR